MYAECGGLMYLMDSIEDFDGTSFRMVGLFPFTAKMSRAHMMIGYRELEIVKPCLLGEPGLKARGHEFHYSTLVPRDTNVEANYACLLTDVKQTQFGSDGLIFHNTLALYTHLYFPAQPLLAKALVDF